MNTRRMGIVVSATSVTALLLSVGSPARAAEPTVTMFRLYNKYTGEHLYTSSTAERDSLKRFGWNDEGIGWRAPKKSKTPVYRLYNKYSGDHHYTTNRVEYDALGKAGWNKEGIGWYSDDAKSTPLYRQFNPYAKVGTHNYTKDKSENDALTELGWRAEGIAWYGAKEDSGEEAPTKPTTGSTSKPSSSGGDNSTGQTKRYVWRTSDGREFRTEQEAKKHAAAASKVVTVTGKTSTWKTSDGKSFEYEQEARNHAEDASYIVFINGSARVWRTDDGKEFLSESEAKRHAKEATTYVAPKRLPAVWLTTDGQSFASKAEAEKHAASASQPPTISSTTRWYTSDGKEFTSKAEAEKHASATTVEPKVESLVFWHTSDGNSYDSKESAEEHQKSIPRPKVTVVGQQRWYSTTDGHFFKEKGDAYYYINVTWKKPEYHKYLDRSVLEPVYDDTILHDYQYEYFFDKETWIKRFHPAGTYNFLYNDRGLNGSKAHLAADDNEAGNYFESTGSPYAGYGTETVSEPFYTIDVVTPGGFPRHRLKWPGFYEKRLLRAAKSKPDVLYITMDNKVFRNEQDAAAYCAKFPQDVEVNEDTTPVWVTSDGNAFASKSEAERHAKEESAPYSVWQETVWQTQTEGGFTSEEEARKYARENRVPVNVSAEVTMWSTSDNYNFDNEQAAEDHAKKTRKDVRVIGAVSEWRSDDGRTYGSWTEANLNSVGTIVKVTGSNEDGATTSDGRSFLSFQDAEKHAKEASREVTVSEANVAWHTSDGRSFKTELDAKSHAASSTVSVKVMGRFER